ncbi:hypothetical protein KVT40_002403 [Elsinoe batatas]|uniref:Uncharacterized protein n=1 Tax=Elsinoe batatas TaxID=2601811 RepID=A0A8K0L6T3_9PEZI|nr:hypothetical protein KVT40_002403 [Elsinoe batatas]
MGAEELDEILRLMERIRNIKGAIEALSEDERECKTSIGMVDDGATSPSKPFTKQQRKAAQRQILSTRDAALTLENLLRRLERREADAQRRREQEKAIQECEATLVDLTFAAERAAVKVAEEQARLTALRRKAEDDKSKGQSEEEEGYAVVKLS